MERSEAAFVPEWLKSSSSVTGGVNNQSGSLWRSDSQSGLKHTRKKPSKSKSEHDIARSPIHTITSPYLLHGSDVSKDSANSRSYDSFNRSHRDREWEDFNGFRGRSKSVHGIHSQSVFKQKQDFPLPNNSNSNGQLLSASNVRNSSQTIHGQDFPSLGIEKGNSSEFRSALSPDGRLSVVNQHVNGLNMAEAVVQGPSRVRTPPQLSVDTQTQRLQELAIKQSRQLIPMTPKIMSIHPGNQTYTSSLGKLHVLKPSREVNGVVALTVNDTSRPNRNPFSIGEDRKLGPTDSEKRTSQSRNDFFNLIKKKSSSIPNGEEVAASWNSSLSVTQVENNATNGDCCNDYHLPLPISPPTAEEAAFLHSLGWEEGSGGFQGLTKEEINDFIKFINTRSALEMEGVQFLRLKNAAAAAESE